MKTATDLIKQFETDHEAKFGPFKNLLASNKITTDEYYDLVTNLTILLGMEWKHGYWKGIQIVKGDEFIMKTLGDESTETQ